MRHLNRWKIAKGCENCGYNKSTLALEWAHILPREGAGIGSKLTNSLKSLFTEIRKCKILCANCHAIETHIKGEWKKPKKD